MTKSNFDKEIAVTVLEPDLESTSSYESIKIKEKKPLECFMQLNEGSYLYRSTKRTFDIFVSFFSLIFLLPFLIVLGVIIKLEDRKGSIIFKQQRVGKNGNIFHMYKFRSMVTNAESLLESLLHLNEVEGAMFKIKEDPRITKIGKFIRKTSLDELPQLWNVLKGDMSLVGPRPPLSREVELYSHYEKQRLIVTPGCTGLWQATERNNVGFQEMVELDLIYISKKSFLYDVKIIFWTIKSIFYKKSGY